MTAPVRSKGSSPRLLVAVALAGALLPPVQGVLAQQASDMARLAVRQPISRTLPVGARHSYLVRLEASQSARVVVEQQGVDVIVTVFAPDGTQLLEVDSPNGRNGPEPADFEAAGAGDYRVEIRPYDADEPEGRYEVRLASVLSAAERAAEQAAQRARHASTVAYLHRAAVPLATVEAGHGFADMAPIGRIVGRARLVALGEATHGTREFFQLKHRMLEYLVARQGFTVFGIEATMPEGFDVNRYVLTGEGDPEKALAGLYFWTWDTQEVLDLIRWMREWNADPAHTRKVKFYGFDMQSAPRAVRVALAYLRRVDPPAAAASESSLAMMANPFTAEDFDALNEADRLRAYEAARFMLARFDARRGEYQARSDRDAWAVARQHARIVVQNLAMALHPDSGFNVRDRSMAENVRWILDFEGPGARMVIWAHNGHVATDSNGSVVWMGHHLRRALGDSMVVFGFAFGRGGFQAMEMPFPSRRGLTVFDVPRLADTTLDGTLGRAGYAVAAWDLRVLPALGPVSQWFAMPHQTRGLGAGYADAFAAAFIGAQDPRRIYDALLYVDSTTAARPNRAGSRSPSGPLPAPVNLDFEETDAGGRPTGWLYSVGRLRAFDFEVTLTELNPSSGRRCLEVRRTPGPHYGELYGGPTQLLDATAWRGGRVRIRAMARLEPAGRDGEARLYAQVAQPQTVRAAPPARLSVVIRDATWRPYEIVVDVPANATTLTLGFALMGDARAWLDAVAVEAVP